MSFKKLSKGEERSYRRGVSTPEPPSAAHSVEKSSRERVAGGSQKAVGVAAFTKLSEENASIRNDNENDVFERTSWGRLRKAAVLMRQDLQRTLVGGSGKPRRQEKSSRARQSKGNGKE